jgi:hypothetical protein
MGATSIGWLPLTAGLTLLGLVLSYIAYKRRGTRPAMMGVAFSLLPIAAYMTGAIQMIWKICSAIGSFATGFVFSPEKWAGIGVTGLAIVLFLAAGGRVRRRASRESRRADRASRKDEADEGTVPQQVGRSRGADPVVTRALSTQRREQVPAERTAAPTRASRKSAPVDDDMKDIEDILRNRGL